MNISPMKIYREPIGIYIYKKMILNIIDYRKMKIKISQKEVRKHVENPLHVKNFLQGGKIEKPKKGKGSFKRHPKHKNNFK